MDIFYLIGLIFITVVSLIFSLLGFMGKDMILDDAYIKASEEEREKMDKKAYRLQGAIIFLFIFALTLCNLLRAVLHIAWFTYVAYAIGAIGILYAIVSHYAIKKKQ
jgi:hypothetical protein